MSVESDEITVRKATDRDFDFFRELHRACFKAYVEQTWGRWNEDEQLQRLRQEFQPMQGNIVLVGGKPIGFLWVEDHGEFLIIDSIAILPQFQNNGIGTYLVRQVVAGSDARNIPVRLSVLKVNPALRLYERLGFRVTGDDEVRHFMERPPRTSDDTGLW
jgi:ribosomal protein S18 acetylase RimI-like enzyme